MKRRIGGGRLGEQRSERVRAIASVRAVALRRNDPAHMARMRGDKLGETRLRDRRRGA